jgi:metallopeptidase MepB
MSALLQRLVPVPAKDEIIPITKSLIEKRWAIIQNIIKTVTTDTACFDNTLGLLAEYDDEISGTMSIIQVLKYASPGQEAQTCVEEVDKLWGEHFNAEQNQIDLVQLIQAAATKKEDLHPEADRMLMKKISWYNQLGYGNVDDEIRQKFLRTKDEIKDLCAKFNRNIRLYDGGHLLFTDEQLDGLTNTDIEQFEMSDDGKRLVPLTRGNLSLICRKVHNSETRKSIDEEWAKRLPENVPIFRKVILLRDENARRMGYKSYAEFCLPNKMANSTEWLDQLHDDLAKKMLPKGREYFTRKEDMKRRILEKCKDSNEDDEVVHPWDIAYIDRFLAEEDSVDYDAISEYLPFKHTVDTVLGRFADYLQVKLEPVTGAALVGNIWSDEVTVWAVSDIGATGGDSFVGYLYGDFEDRKNKYKHNQTVTVQPVSRGSSQYCFY